MASLCWVEVCSEQRYLSILGGGHHTQISTNKLMVIESYNVLIPVVFQKHAVEGESLHSGVLLNSSDKARVIEIF